MTDSYPLPSGGASVSPHSDREFHSNADDGVQQPFEDDRGSGVRSSGEDDDDDYYSILNVPREVRFRNP